MVDVSIVNETSPEANWNRQRGRQTDRQANLCVGRMRLQKLWDILREREDAIFCLNNFDQFCTISNFSRSISIYLWSWSFSSCLILSWAILSYFGLTLDILVFFVLTLAISGYFWLSLTISCNLLQGLAIWGNLTQSQPIFWNIAKLSQA